MNKITPIIKEKKEFYGDKPIKNIWLLGEKKGNVGGELMRFLEVQPGRNYFAFKHLNLQILKL